MAKKITIPITDHSEHCTGFYLVEYKLSSDSTYSSFMSFTNEVVINNVLDGATYNIRITRNCCDQGVSNPLSLSVSTGS